MGSAKITSQVRHGFIGAGSSPALDLEDKV
jgi:hypothetical protein